MASDGGGIDREQISPELVLVDPELAERARERLAVAPFPAVEPQRSRAASTGGRRADSRRRRTRLRAAVGALVALIAVGALAAIVTGVPSSVSRQVHRGKRHGAPAATRAAPSPARATARPDPRPPRAARSSARSPAPAHHPKHVRPARKRAAAAPRPARQPRVRVFAWPPAAGARFYLVEFFRGRKKIYEARPSAPRLALPARWTFRGRRYRLAPGRYRWRVRALSGPRRNAAPAKVIVSAKLQIRAQNRR